MSFEYVVAKTRLSEKATERQAENILGRSRAVTSDDFNGAIDLKSFFISVRVEEFDRCFDLRLSDRRPGGYNRYGRESEERIIHQRAVDRILGDGGLKDRLPYNAIDGWATDASDEQVGVGLHFRDRSVRVN